MSLLEFLLRTIVVSCAFISARAQGSSSGAASMAAIRINCGGPSYKDSLGRSWGADQFSVRGKPVKVVPSSSSLTTTLEDSSFANTVLFETFREWSKLGGYSIPVAAKGLYFIRLGFAEMVYSNPQLRSFSVAINNFTVLENYNTNSPAYATLWEFLFPINATAINIDFTPILGNPYINIIEITAAEPGQYHDGLPDDVVLISTLRQIAGGGGAILSSTSDAVADSLGRIWAPDSSFYYTNPSSETRIAAKSPPLIGTGVPPDNYSDYVYRGQRFVTAGNDTDDGLTLPVPQSTAADFLVRLHFAELVLTQRGQRLLDIYLQNELKNQSLDVFEAAGGANRTFHLSLLASTTSVAPSLTVKIQASNDSSVQEPILNAIEIFQLLYLNPAAAPSTKGKTSSISTGAIIGISVGTGVTILLVTVAGIVIGQNLARKADQGYLPGDEGGRALLKRLHDRQVGFVPLADIEIATDKFSKERLLGQGGFGMVYLGKPEASTDGRIWAVKRANKESHQPLNVFKDEVDLISQLNHVNLLALMGFCTERKEQILIYEFMPNGTVRDHLRPKPGKSSVALTWQQRLEIAIGSARGINYLHSFAKQPFIHRDIKTENILLDANFQPKVSDFGLLKRLKDDPNDSAPAHIVGTRGYCDPEYYETFQVTDKSDVYSFGVVLLEILSGQPPILFDLVTPENTETLVAWAKVLVAQGRWHDLADKAMEGQYPVEGLIRIAELALLCTQQHGQDRPPMAAVTRGLERVILGDFSAIGRSSSDALGGSRGGSSGRSTGSSEGLPLLSGSANSLGSGSSWGQSGSGSGKGSGRGAAAVGGNHVSGGSTSSGSNLQPILEGQMSTHQDTEGSFFGYQSGIVPR